MKRYNYLEAVTNDVRDYVAEEITLTDFEDANELRDYLNDTLWGNDSITGASSETYTFNYFDAEEYLCHNWDLAAEALAELGSPSMSTIDIFENPEYVDVTIRCHLLPRAIDDVISELFND